MRCIFCKIESSDSKSKEHVIPESLGNKEYILSNGIVCDNCNKYFATKVEKVILETPYFKSLRHRNDIANKKNKIPLQSAIMGGEVFIDKNSGDRSIIIDDPRIIRGILDGNITSMIIPMNPEPPKPNIAMARFIGKIALEALALRVQNNQSLLDEIVDEMGLNLLRNFVRNGDSPPMWEYNQRRIYPEGAYFYNPKNSEDIYEVLHEFTFIYTPNTELFAIIAIMGVEYAINLGGPSIEDYKKWLMANKHASPLDENRMIIQHSNSEWNIGDNLHFLKSKY